MAFFDTILAPFAGYTNPLVVAGAFFILIFLVVFTMLMRVPRLNQRKQNVAIISIIISVIAIMNMQQAIYWIQGFNMILVLAIIAFFAMLFLGFFRRRRR